MSQHPNFGEFIKENKTLLKEYVETRIEIVRLEAIRTELIDDGVHVMWVCPGFTASNIRNAALNEKEFDGKVIVVKPANPKPAASDNY